MSSTALVVSSGLYKVSHPQRGAGLHKTALRFVKDFPVGTSLSAEKFDDWAERLGLFVVPVWEGGDKDCRHKPLKEWLKEAKRICRCGAKRNDPPKKSDAWLAHLQRRHILRNDISNSGSHSRMIESESTPFTISNIKAGVWEVRSPASAISQSDLAQRIVSLCETKRTQLRYWMEAEDWSKIPPAERVMAETILDDVSYFKDDLLHKEKQLNQKFAKLKGRLTALGVLAITDQSSEENE